MSAKESDYIFIRDFMHEKAGVTIGVDKQYLIDARLRPLIKQYDVEDMNSLVEVLRKGKEVYVGQSVIDALTTHETYFFRDIKPFDLLRNKLLPELIAKKKDSKKISIWSAACSTGQELYSICMLLNEILPTFENWSLNLLGTDISQVVIEKAIKGQYFEHEVKRGLSEAQLKKYFIKVNNKWQIKLPKKFEPKFQNFNLVDNFSRLGKFDIILLRNVLIYFEGDERIKILEQTSKALDDDGSLILGSAESTSGYSDSFKRVTHSDVSYYIKK